MRGDRDGEVRSEGEQENGRGGGAGGYFWREIWKLGAMVAVAGAVILLLMQYEISMQ